MKNIRDWLQEIGLEQYADLFADNDIDIEVVGDLTELDLENLGMSLGHRKRLLHYLHKADDELRKGSHSALSAGESLNEPREPGAAEKRFLTIMFCDLADSTRLAAEMEVDEIHDLNRLYQSAASEIIRNADGYVAKYMGDGVLAYFGYPGASEDDAERAINAGLEITAKVEELNAVSDLPRDMALAVRIGIASGPVVIDPIGEGASAENAVVGEVPNIAARLKENALHNSVTISNDTLRLVEHKFDLVYSGRKSIKGYAEPFQTWRVTGRKSLEDRYILMSEKHMTSMVGRDEELNLMMSRWQRALAGNGQVVLLSGEPGIGKTRLVDAVLAMTGEQGRKVRYFCSRDYSKKPLYPFISRLFGEIGNRHSDDAEVTRDIVSSHLRTEYGFSPELVRAVITLSFLDREGVADSGHPDPQFMMRQLQEGFVDRILSDAGVHPLVIVVEDAHWIDASTNAVLELLSQSIHSLNVLLLITHRPEKSIRYNSSNVTYLSLGNLTRDQAVQVIREASAQQEVPADVINLISEKSAGIPLFLEEVIKSVVGEGENMQSIPGVEDHDVPDTLQAFLVSTLDKLGNARKLAQIGSVIGSSFSRKILLHVSGLSDEQIDSGMTRLLEHQITVREYSPGGETQKFRHALLRDAAYESLLKKNRIEIHRLIAEYLDSDSQKNERDNESLIAHHYEMAHQPEKAFLNWVNAGETAFAAGATMEAVELLHNAQKNMSLLDAGDMEKARLYRFYLTLGRALNASQGASSREAHDAFREAVKVAEDLHHIDQQVDALDYLFGITFNSGKLGKAMEYANRMLKIGSENGNRIATISGYQGLGMVYCTMGQLQEAREQLEAALKHEDGHIEGINCYPSMTMDYLSYVDALEGNSQNAVLLCSQAIRSAREESDYAEATALTNSCFTQMLAGDYESVLQYSGEAIRRAESRGQLMVSSRAVLFFNLATARLNKSTEHLEKVVIAINTLKEAEEYIDLTYLTGMTAELQIQMGYLDDAAELLKSAFEICKQTGERFYLPELLRLQVELGINLRDDRKSLSELEQTLNDARETAAAQNAIHWLKEIESTRLKLVEV